MSNDHDADLRSAMEINALAIYYHDRAAAKGWWKTLEGEFSDGPTKVDPHEIGTKLGLIHAEVSEALEAYRINSMDKHLPHRKGVECELADIMIRVLDLAGALGLDVGGAMVEKDDYNSVRPDHMPENRNKKGGKLF